MKRYVIVPLIILTLVISTVIAATRFAGAAHADNPAGYDIEVQMVYCINQDKPCNTFKTIRNSQYVQVEAVSFHPGVTDGTPDAVDFTCGQAYIDDNGIVHDVAEHSFAGYEGGTITGNAELDKVYGEKSTHAEGAIETVRAFDPVTGDTGVAVGEISTNNVTDLRLGGGFNLKLNGPIYDEYVDSHGKFHSKVVGHGEMDCESYSPYVKHAPFASGPFFEAVLNNSDND